MHTVIMVDDEPWVAVDAAQSIAWGQCGFRVAEYLSNPQEALQKICDLQPSLCIVDIRMPEMDGLELIHRCMEAGVKSGFIILSGYSDFEYARQALRMGVTDYWLKPLDPDVVQEKLCALNAQLGSDEQQGVRPDEEFAQVLEYIRLNAAKKLRLEDLAGVFGFNKNYLCSLFKSKIDMSFVQYLTKIRLESGCDLLRTTSFSLDEIASRSGLNDAAYFSKVFKKNMEMTPAQYRRGVWKE
ncbi:MAG: AraC family transcriptional regulator [Clostridia bacterium]